MNSVSRSVRGLPRLIPRAVRGPVLPRLRIVLAIWFSVLSILCSFCWGRSSMMSELVRGVRGCGSIAILGLLLFAGPLTGRSQEFFPGGCDGPDAICALPQSPGPATGFSALSDVRVDSGLGLGASIQTNTTLNTCPSAPSRPGVLRLPLRCAVQSVRTVVQRFQARGRELRGSGRCVRGGMSMLSRFRIRCRP